MELNWGLALFCGVWYYIAQSRIGYHLANALGTPLFISFLLGLILGNMHDALILGGSIQLLYLGVIATGGNMPSDSALAALIAIPVALQTGLNTETAVAIAVPFGVLGAFVDQVRRTVNATFIHKADECAERGDADKIWWYNTVPTVAFNFVLRFIPVFIATLFGADIITAILNVIPEFVTHGLSVAGGILPAVGFAITIMTIGKKQFLPFFFIGFFLVQYLKIDTMAATVFGICIAMLYIAKKEEAR